MSRIRSLHGGCVCGRNEFIVNVPTNAISQLQVLLDNSSLTRHTTAPLTPFLRVPLDWYHSVTYAFFPDETHRSIRRTFSSPQGPASQRQFCGFCGTQLSSWNEQTAEDASSINVNMGSLDEDDVALLDTWGLLQADSEEEEKEKEQEDHTEQGGPVAESESSAPPQQPTIRNRIQRMRHRGEPWFEEMVEDSRLGRIRRQRGGYESRDGNRLMQWEIVELGNGGTEHPLEETMYPGKRKRGNSNGPTEGDVQMGD